jgi:hypothetical protein
VALNLNEFYLSKKSASKAANSNGRPLDCRIWGFFQIKATVTWLKMPNLGHDAAGSAANAAYFGAFLVKGN